MNAIFNIRRAIWIIVLMASAFFLYRWNVTDLNNDNTVPQQANRSDYSMSDFTTTIMGVEGKPVRIISGKEMKHYPQDDSVKITQPVSVLFQPDKDTWKIRANKAVTTSKSDIVLLTGNVIISNQDNPDYIMRTEKLTINNTNNTAYTDMPATMYSSEGVTHTVGFDAHQNSQIVNLHSKVKGVYNAQ